MERFSLCSPWNVYAYGELPSNVDHVTYAFPCFYVPQRRHCVDVCAGNMWWVPGVSAVVVLLLHLHYFTLKCPRLSQETEYDSKVRHRHDKNEYASNTKEIEYAYVGHGGLRLVPFVQRPLRSARVQQGCQIESKSNRISLSNRMFLQESNQMQIESNDFLDFRYDSIQPGQKGD
jgi:hypothetical protein